MSAALAPGDGPPRREALRQAKPPATTRVHAARARALPLAIGIGGLALALALALVARSLRPRAPLAVLGHIPSFQLIDGRGAPFTSSAMLGHVNVVDFIFTRCTSSCPRLTARMIELQDRLGHHGGDVRLVSFSVDPENDTPPVLTEYAARANADPTRWTFVTGQADDVAKAVVLGFKVSAAKIANGASDDDVVHGDWFVLVDRAGDFRGYYRVGQAQEFEALIDDVTRLEGEHR